MQNISESRIAEAAQMESLAKFMHCRVTRDECGDAVIQGKAGNIHVDGSGYSVAVMLDSSQQWTWAKKRLRFCQVRQDGDEEGVLHLAQLPTPEQAETLRDILSVHKIPEYTPETLELKRSLMRRARESLKEQAPLASQL